MLLALLSNDAVVFCRRNSLTVGAIEHPCERLAGALLRPKGNKDTESEA